MTSLAEHGPLIHEGNGLVLHEPFQFLIVHPQTTTVPPPEVGALRWIDDDLRNIFGHVVFCHLAVVINVGQKLFVPFITIEKARQLSAAEQNVIRVGTSILRPCKRLIHLWAEIDGGSQPPIQRGDSPVLNQMRGDIAKNHPHECDQANCLMETLDIGTNVHPSLVTLPMNWEYKMPYGVVYASSPSQAVRDFIAIVQERVPLG